MRQCTAYKSRYCVNGTLIPSKIYLDTNVYARLVDTLAPTDYPRLALRLHARSVRVYLSPTNILEFLQTRDAKRRKQLVCLAQFLCAEDLLVEVEAILVDQVATATGDNRLSALRLESPFGSGGLAATWRDVRSDKRSTFLIDRGDLDRFQIVKDMFKLLHAHLRRGGSAADLWEHLPPLHATTAAELRVQVADALSRRRAAAPPSKNPLSIPFAACIQLMTLAVFCVGLSPFVASIDQFWILLGISAAGERFRYTLENLPFMLKEGCLVGMGQVMAHQATHRYGPGNLFDCYHVCYTGLTDVTYTFDLRLLALNSTCPLRSPLRRMRPADEFLAIAVG
jgi:hypothetical protein